MGGSIKKRQEMDKKYMWKIDDMFPSDEAWQQEFEDVTLLLPSLEKFRGKLSESADTLYSCLKQSDIIDEKSRRVYVYAFLRFYEDTGNQLYKGMSDRAATLSSKVSAASSFINPELLGIDEKRLKAFLSENNDLNVYAHFIEDLIRQKKHVLPAEQEEIIAKSAEISRSAHDIFSIFHEADMKFGTIKDEEGNETPLTLGNYISFLESRDRRVRKDAFDALYGQITRFKNTYAGTFSASVISDNFYADVRRYDSALHMALSGDNIPVDVYKNLIATVHEFLPELHKYVSLRKKRLGLSELHMYDLYTPIVPDVNTYMPYDKAKELFINSIQPLGQEYVDVVKNGMDSGWIDVYENENKRSGAFQWGVYGCHPFVCLNYDNKVNDMFTLAHEMGHAMHSYYTWAAQPFVYSDYTIFLAEVASTVNESLLMEHMLKTTEDKTMREYLINYFLEQFRGTVFRQVMFAEFEMITHEMAANGEPLTSDTLSRVYYELNKKYYGDDIVIDDEIAVEWARIPHFYNAFYVYKYATGYSAAITLSRMILNSKNAVNKYIEFLKSGSSDYSINILREAGVDMSSPEPVRGALSVFSDLIKQMATVHN